MSAPEPSATLSGPEVAGDHTLHIDGFGLSIDAVSVGLPRSCTADEVFRRYLDLVRLVRRSPGTLIVAPEDDLRALSRATALDGGVVARRLSALQGAGP